MPRTVFPRRCWGARLCRCPPTGSPGLASRQALGRPCPETGAEPGSLLLAPTGAGALPPVPGVRGLVLPAGPPLGQKPQRPWGMQVLPVPSNGHLLPRMDRQLPGPGAAPPLHPASLPAALDAAQLPATETDIAGMGVQGSQWGLWPWASTLCSSWASRGCWADHALGRVLRRRASGRRRAAGEGSWGREPPTRLPPGRPGAPTEPCRPGTGNPPLQPSPIIAGSAQGLGARIHVPPTSHTGAITHGPARETGTECESLTKATPFHGVSP